ncbi:carbamate kinase [Borrelia sp. P9F1]|uniref:carbamate kinase n=1 Tax=Borrelia sp. P9F1 TaxID=3058374 RepID=UPI00264A2275|nr:carbamate kinase [Borrelia sp. P9F1]WKC58379.1 carbamate kinase [Borrelia sp. P9F1]
MSGKKMVICLGGNALEDGSGDATAEKQLEVIRKSITGIVDLVESGYEVVISHGNGPQVGRIVLQNEVAKHETPAMPLDICGAMSQGMIGYHIEQALRNEFNRRGMSKDVAVLITQVIVDKEDKGFRDPSKPIGPFYDRATALELEKSKGYVLREDSGRGYRRVVASPMPVEIVEIEAIKELIGKGFMVIACGGGGVPLARDLRGNIEGVSAVIDKDFASSRLAQDVGADVLIILTAVEKVSLNFGKSDEILLGEVNTSEMEKYIDEGHFAAGSMLPKVQAGVEFVKSSEGRVAIITSLDKLGKDIENARDGTIIKG